MAIYDLRLEVANYFSFKIAIIIAIRLKTIKENKHLKDAHNVETITKANT